MITNHCIDFIFIICSTLLVCFGKELLMNSNVILEHSNYASIYR